LTERNLVNNLLQQHLLRAQQMMKQQADKKRCEKEFKVGDMVYLKLQPHIQSSVAVRSSQKLSFRFFGPFKILARVGAVAYKLDLPNHAQIHPVVHVSQLKLQVHPNTEIAEDLGAVSTDPEQGPSPVMILAVRDIMMGGKLKQQVLVQWEHQPSCMSTWEDPENMKRKFGTAWGQAAAKAGGNVRNLIRRSLKESKHGNRRG
jgi:hypothetical protein